MQGDEVALVVELRNPRPWPRFGLTIVMDLVVNDVPQGKLRLFTPYLAPKGRLVFHGVMTYSRRGLNTVQGLVVESAAPFGLFRRARRFSGEASLLIYPSPYALNTNGAKELISGSVTRSLPVRRGEEVSGSRPYVSGDTARAVHWRNFARTGRLMTKTFTTSIGEALILTFGATPEGDALLDDVLRLAAGVGQLWTQRGGQVRLQTGSKGRELGWEGMLRDLALASSKTVSPLCDSLQAIPSGSNIVAVVSSWDKAGLDGLIWVASRMASLRVLLLAPTGKEEDSLKAAVVSLGRAGAIVSRFESPLPVAHGEGKPTMTEAYPV